MMALNKAIRAVSQPEQMSEMEIKIRWPVVLFGTAGVTLATAFVIAFIMLSLVAVERFNRIDASTKRAEKAMSAMNTEIISLRNQLKDNTDAEIIFLKVIVLNPQVKHELARKIAASVHHHSKVFKRDPDFVLAIMEIESNFNPKAVSSVGAEGLMQVMPHWKDIMGITGDLKDIDTNVRAGLQVYGFYEEMYNEMGLALAAYNRGPSRVDRDITHRRNPERNGYSNKVETAYHKLKSMRMNAGL